MSKILKLIGGCMLVATACLGLGCAGRDTATTGQVGHPAAGNREGKVILTGSSTMAPLVEAIAKRFQALHPGVEVTVKGGGSARGVEDVQHGTSNIGMVSRPLDSDEAGLHSFPVARDGVCLIVHQDNPVSGLTTSEVPKIYTGKITHWNEVGGEDIPITAISRTEGRGSVELFNNYFKIKSDEMVNPPTPDDNAQIIQLIAEQRHAITYMSLGEAERSANHGIAIKLLALNGVSASVRNLRTGRYPVCRPLNLVTRELPSGLMHEFITFAMSSSVVDLIEQNNFVPYLD